MPGTGTIRSLDLDDTLALKAGAGWDFFIDDNFAVNIEIGWKYNQGNANAQVDQAGVVTNMGLAGGFDASEITGLAGLRYFF